MLSKSPPKDCLFRDTSSLIPSQLVSYVEENTTISTDVLEWCSERQDFLKKLWPNREKITDDIESVIQKKGYVVIDKVGISSSFLIRARLI